MTEYVIIYKYTDNSGAGIVAVAHTKDAADYILNILNEHGDKFKDFSCTIIDNPEIIINRG